MLPSTLTKAAFPFGLIGARPPPSTSSMPQNASSHVQSTAPIQGGPPPGALTPGFGNTYTFYQGDGSNWPPVSEWVDFYTMWEANEGMMNKSCTTMGGWGVKDNSPTENEDILEAISEEAKATGVDQRFILAVIMQESKGCVRVHSTTSPGAAIHNPGLMQTHNGKGSCNDGPAGIQTPCPSAMIKQMVKDGAAGTADGDGLKQTLSKASGSGAAKYYRAARAYNSGSVDPSGDLGKGCCTHCYASDIANRLTGWVTGDSKCTLDGGLW